MIGKRILLAAIAGLVLLAAVVAAMRWRDDGARPGLYTPRKLDAEEYSKRLPLPAPGTIPQAEPDAPTIVLAVLDTVRADRTSVCGHTRETTPFLSEMVERGASLACRAYVPGDWSWPSHSSFFTGLTVDQHGASYAPAEAGGQRIGKTSVRPLTGGTTLAEFFAARGYQTVLVSENGLLATGGLERGFEIVRTRPEELERPVFWAPAVLRHLLAEEIDPQRPLFLVLNFLDAHAPWIPVGAEAPFAAEVDDPLSSSEFLREVWPVIRGRAEPEVERRLRRHWELLYDHGVWREDLALQRSFGLLEEAGWLDEGFRVAVVSDHGEYLAEHGMWGHRFVYESNVRVPLVLWGDPPAPPLQEPISAIALHGWLRDGAVAADLPPPHVISLPNPDRTKLAPAHRAPAAALWAGEEKLAWIGGEYRLYRPLSDPGDLEPLPLPPDHPHRAEIEALAAAAQAVAERPAEALAPEVEDRLRALGYLD